MSPEKLVISPSSSPRFRAQYGKLVAALHRAQVERGAKVVMVTSCGASEGKTLTTANIALTLSEAYRKRVLVMDADLRKPTVHAVFGVPNELGLCNLTDTGQLPLVQVSALLSLIVAGSGGDDPSMTLTSDVMHTIVKTARASFDWVLIDTPPVGIVPDATLLAPLVDGAILVAMSGKTAYDQLQGTVGALTPSLWLGVVLNRVPDHEWSSDDSGGYYGHYLR